MRPSERVGFLSKLNGRATPRSILRRAATTCVAAAALWALALVVRPNPNWRPSWPAFVGWIACAAITGAAWEWQVPDDEDDVPGG